MMAMPPEGWAHAAEAGLHLVGDDQAACLVHPRNDALQVAGRRVKDAVGHEGGINHHRGNAEALLLQVADQRIGKGRIARARVIVLRAIGAAIDIWRGQQADVRGLPVRGRIRRRKGVNRLAHAMIGEFHRKPAGMAGEGLGHAPCKVVRLAAGIDEGHRGEALGSQLRQPFGIFDRLVCDVARVGAERARLPRDGLRHVRLRVAHMRHVVVAVEIALAVGGSEPHALALHDVQRRVVEDIELLAHHLAAPCDGFCGSFRVLRRNAGESGGAADQGAQPVVPDPTHLADHRHAAAVEGLEIVLRSNAVRGLQRVDERGHQQANVDEVDQCIGLGLLQRRHAAVAAYQFEDGVGNIRRGRQEIARRIGEIENQGAVHHVAEVDDAGHLARGVDKHVVGMNVAVDDLGAHAAECRHGDRLVARQNLRGKRAVAFRKVADLAGQPQHVARVPDQITFSRRAVDETAQRHAEAGQ